MRLSYESRKTHTRAGVASDGRAARGEALVTVTIDATMRDKSKPLWNQGVELLHGYGNGRSVGERTRGCG